MESQKTQLNVRLPGELHRDVKAVAKRKGLTLDEFAERLFRAAVASETSGSAPGFLEAWEKFLTNQAGKKKT